MLAVVTTQDEAISFGDFIAVAAFLTSFLLPVLGIMVLTSEWSQRSAMVTFALEPRRSLVIAAKALVGVLLTLATVAVSIAIGFVCNVLYGLIEGNADWTFGWPDFAAFLVTQVLAMLGGFALAALLLNTPAAIVLFFVYKWVLPGLFAIGAALMGWFDDARALDRLPERAGSDLGVVEQRRGLGPAGRVRPALARPPAGDRDLAGAARRGEVARPLVSAA